MGKSISFTVASEDEKNRIETYAQEKGFLRVSELARFALYQYMARYPSKRTPKPGTAQGCTAEGVRGQKQH